MRFLIDENIPISITRWLEEEGHDVAVAGLIRASTPDSVWLSQSIPECRLILTSDKDYGDLIFRDSLPAYGIVLLRLKALPVFEWLPRLQETWGVIEANPSGKFIVVKPTRIRVRPLT